MIWSNSSNTCYQKAYTLLIKCLLADKTLEITGRIFVFSANVYFILFIYFLMAGKFRKLQKKKLFLKILQSFVNFRNFSGQLR